MLKNYNLIIGLIAL